MADLKWRGCGEGSYVSHDGRFLIAQVQVPGKKGAKTAWALYGRVAYQYPAGANPPPPWSWGIDPLTVWPQKKQCQEWAAGSDYEPATRVRESEPAETDDRKPVHTRGYNDCVECGVEYNRNDPKHKTGDYCGINCVETVAERLMEIQDSITIKDLEGTPLRVRAALPNEPGYRPNPPSRRRG